MPDSMNCWGTPAGLIRADVVAAAEQDAAEAPLGRLAIVGHGDDVLHLDMIEQEAVVGALAALG
jgi:hypothetical protein